MNLPLYHQIALQSWRYTPVEMSVLLCYAYHADGVTAVSYPSLPTVAGYTRWSESSVKRAMASLRAKHVLVPLEGGRGKENFTKYRVWPAGRAPMRQQAAERDGQQEVEREAGQAKDTGYATAGVARCEEDRTQQDTAPAPDGGAVCEEQAVCAIGTPVDKPVERLCASAIWEVNREDLGGQPDGFGRSKGSPYKEEEKDEEKDEEKSNYPQPPSFSSTFSGFAVEKQPQPQKLPGEGKGNGVGVAVETDGDTSQRPRQQRWSRELSRERTQARNRQREEQRELERARETTVVRLGAEPLPPEVVEAARGVLRTLLLADESLVPAVARSLAAWLAKRGEPPEAGVAAMVRAWAEWRHLAGNGCLRYTVAPKKFLSGLCWTPELWPLDRERLRRARQASIGSYGG